MSEQYYIKVIGAWGGSNYEPVDIGWRWCKDELPEKEDWYIVVMRLGLSTIPTTACWFRDGKWYSSVYDSTPVINTPTQWCRLPEPLKEAQNDE